jgi:hypothetical protein
MNICKKKSSLFGLEVDGEDNDRHGHYHQLTVLCSILLHRSRIRLFPLGLTSTYYCYSTTIIIITVISVFIIISKPILFSSLFSSHPHKSLYHTHVSSHFYPK